MLSVETGKPPGGRRGQVKVAKRKLMGHMGEIFQGIIPREEVEQVCRFLGHVWRERLFTPLVTLWTFLSQALEADSSCRQAVAKTLAWLSASEGMDASHDPSAYAKARKRLPKELLRELAHRVAAKLRAQLKPGDLWHERRVMLLDGTSVTLADSPENQKEYPQPAGQKQGCGFPMARLVGLFDLFTGAVVDMVLGPLRMGETMLFHTLWHCLRPGDIVVADEYYGSYAEVVRVRQRGAHGVWRLHHRRKPTPSRETPLGPGDSLVEWIKGARPAWMTPEEYAALPATQTVRVVKFERRVPGGRPEPIEVVTTLLDPAAYPAWEIAHLFGRRWEVETDFDHLKTTLHLEFLRTRTPEMVYREVWAHLLAYNLIRTLMWEAVPGHRLVSPLQLSFKGAVQEMIALWPFSACQAKERDLTPFYQALLRGIASHRLPYRPDRAEPRVRKRRPKNYRLMTQPRSQYREDVRNHEY